MTACRLSDLKVQLPTLTSATNERHASIYLLKDWSPIGSPKIHIKEGDKHKTAHEIWGFNYYSWSSIPEGHDITNAGGLTNSKSGWILGKATS